MRAICVDVDDVLAQTVQTLLGLLEERFGRRLSLDQVTSFDLGVSFSRQRRFQSLARLLAADSP